MPRSRDALLPPPACGCHDASAVFGCVQAQVGSLEVQMSDFKSCYGQMVFGTCFIEYNYKTHPSYCAAHFAHVVVVASVAEGRTWTLHLP